MQIENKINYLEQGYKLRCHISSDINEHLPTLYNYSLMCNHITECGVRSLVSSYAFGYGLIGKQNSKLIQVDPEKSPEHSLFKVLCEEYKIENVFYNESDLTCPLEQTDLLFIDTWHVYGQLKRELARWNKYVNKYIIMHDTTVDEIYGETLRSGWNPVEQSKKYNMPIYEITHGLWAAVEEFLRDNKEWQIDFRYTNNNGLTILKRV